MRARNMEELIQKKFDMLNENDLQIWAYIVRHKEQCKQISIQHLAVFVMYHIPRSCDLQRSWGFLDIVRCDLS